jgi:hypothetical protein
VLRSIILLCSGAVVVWFTCSGNLRALKKICSVQMSSPLGDGLDSDEEAALAARRGQGRALDLSVSEREVKKREKKEMISAQLAEAVKQEALKDDKNAFSVVIGAKTSTLEGSSCLSISQALNKKLHLFS